MAVQITTNPIALPACCMVCGGGAHNRNYFIDFGVEGYDDRFGTLYLCDQCLTFIAYMAGFLPPTNAEDLRHENDLLNAANELLNNRVEQLLRAIESLKDAGFTGSFDTDVSHPSRGDSLVSETVESESGESETRKSELAVGKKRLTKSSDDETLGDIRSTFSIDSSD